MVIDRRTLLAGSAALGTLAAAGGLRAQQHGLRAGKPFAGQTVNVLLPIASQFRGQQKHLAEFEALTGIKANYEYIPYGQLRDKIATEGVAGSSNYDVVCYQDSWGPSLAQYLQPVDEWLKRDGIDMARYPDAYVQSSSFEGKVYGLPVRSHPQLLFYRKDLLEKAGVAPPKTWDEVIAVAQKVQTPDVSGLAMYYGKGNGAQNLFLWLNYLWGKGSDVLADAGRQVRFNDAAGVEATQMYLDLLLRHKVAAPGSVQFVEGDAVTSVAQGKSAMVMVWWWVYSVLTGPNSTLKPEQVGFAPMPSFPGAKAATFALTLPFAVSALSRRKDAAFEFLKWAGNPDLEVKVSTDKSDPNTADIVVTHKASFVNERVNAANFGLHREASKSLEGARIMPQLRDWPQMAEVLESTISQLATGSTPVKAGLDDAARQIDAIIRRSGRRG